MKIAASVFVGLAALLHFFIFWMESVGWTRPEVWKRFGVADQAAADVTRPMAYNQGFYNLFLGIGAALGLVLWWTDHDTAGRTLALFCTGSMVGRRGRARHDRPQLPARRPDPGHAAAHRPRADAAQLTSAAVRRTRAAPTTRMTTPTAADPDASAE